MTKLTPGFRRDLVKAATTSSVVTSDTSATGTVTILPPNGAWFVYGVDYDDEPLALFSDELSARRWADEEGYGTFVTIVFWPFGKTWEEARHG